MINLKSLLSFFKEDGSYRDLYVLTTRITDWGILYARILETLESKLLIDGEEKQNIELKIEELFRLSNVHSICLEVLINNKQLNTYFFEEQQIEFDISPKEIKNENDIEDIIEFMKFMNSTLKRSVYLTPENSPDIHV